MIRAIAILMFTLISTPEPSLGGGDLCCHKHADGSVGCWPLVSYQCGDDPGEYIKPCVGGSHQTDPNDEESWVCNRSGEGV